MSAQRQTDRVGFTLIEVILAVSLSAVLFVLVGAGMHAYTRIVSNRRTDVANAQLARAILERIASDIRGAYYSEEAAQDTSVTEDEDAGTGDTSTDTQSVVGDLTQATAQPSPGLYGNAYELQMDVLGQFAKPVKFDMLVSAGLDPFASNLFSEPKITTYYLRSTDPSELIGTPLESFNTDATSQQLVLVRRVQGRAKAIFAAQNGGATATTEGEQLLSDQVVSLSFSYFDGLSWLDEWDSSLMAGLPLAVQITLVVVDDLATADMDATTLTEGNIYRLTVPIPSAEISADTSSAGL